MTENSHFDSLSVDQVHIDEMIFKGRHGVGAEERAVPQEFKVEVTLGVDVRSASKSDFIDDTVDYQTIKDGIQTIVESESHALVEKIAERIWDEIRVDIRIRFARISIKKLEIWRNGIPGVTVTRFAPPLPEMATA